MPDANPPVNPSALIYRYDEILNESFDLEMPIIVAPTPEAADALVSMGFNGAIARANGTPWTEFPREVLDLVESRQVLALRSAINDEHSVDARAAINVLRSSAAEVLLVTAGVENINAALVSGEATPENVREWINATVEADRLGREAFYGQYSKPGHRPLTDMGNGERIADFTNGKLIYDLNAECWYSWKRGVWMPQGDIHVQSIAREALFEIQNEIKARAQTLGAQAAQDDEVLKALRTHAKNSASMPRLKASTDAAKVILGVPHERFDDDAQARMLNCANGVVDLATGKLMPHSRARYFRNITPVPYIENAPCPHWQEFIASTFPDEFGGESELAKYVQTAFGFGCTGHEADGRFFFLTGSGSNGKSVILDIIERVLGPFVAKLPNSLLTSSPSDDGSATPQLVGLDGARLGFVPEMPTNRRLNDDRVKLLTGGESYFVRPLYKSGYYVRPVAKIFTSGNNLPSVVDTTPAIWRRIKLIPFEVRFWKADDPDFPGMADNIKMADPTLKEKLIAEMPGILAWLVRGAMNYYQNGLVEPDVVKAEIVEYRHEANWMDEIVVSCFELNSSLAMRSTDAYDVARMFLEQTGRRHMVGKNGGLSSTGLGRYLKSLAGVSRARTNHGVMYYGIAPSTTWANALDRWRERTGYIGEDAPETVEQQGQSGFNFDDDDEQGYEY